MKVSLACSFVHVNPEKIKIKYAIETQSLLHKSNRIIQIAQRKPQCGNTRRCSCLGIFKEAQAVYLANHGGFFS